MTPFDRFPACPLVASCSTCFARTSGNPRLCELVQTHQDYQTLVEDRTMGRKPINTHATTDPGGIRARETLANIRAVNACHWRTNPETGCLAGCATCTRPGKEGRVTCRDCFKCLGFPA